jgi:hypothetical protein
LDLSLHYLKYSYNVKYIKCLKCIICIECYIFQHVSHSSDSKSGVNNSQQEEQSLHADEPQHSFSWKYHSTPIKSGTSRSKTKLFNGGNTEAAEHHSANSRSLCLEHTDLSYIADITDQLSAGETCYKVCQRNSPPARGQQLSADENDMPGHKIDTLRLENLASEVRCRQNQGDGRHAYSEGHDCVLCRTYKRQNLHRRHSSANPRLHEV